jgi:hypothetical protein
VLATMVALRPGLVYPDTRVICVRVDVTNQKRGRLAPPGSRSNERLNERAIVDGSVGQERSVLGDGQHVIVGLVPKARGSAKRRIRGNVSVAEQQIEACRHDRMDVSDRFC